MSEINRNTLTFIALANEYCSLIERTLDFEKDDYAAKMLKILPRIYMSITDFNITETVEDYYISPFLEEDVYDIVREKISRLMGDDDAYLEVFVEDMKYSDSPITAFISENLADLYQELYNFVASARDVPHEAITALLIECKENFANYWGQTLCNVVRALHTAFYNHLN